MRKAIDPVGDSKPDLASRREDIEIRIMITDRVEQGVVFMPFHFEEANVNKLTNPVYEPDC